jgi:DNA-binding XRE family transcriptional regulator
MTEGETLKKFREVSNISQEHLAKELGVTDVYISFIERGKRKPSIELARKIKRLTGIDFGCPCCGREVDKWVNTKL